MPITVTFLALAAKTGGATSLLSTRLKFLEEYHPGSIQPRLCTFLPLTERSYDVIGTLASHCPTLEVRSLNHKGPLSAPATLVRLLNESKKTDILHLMYAPISYTLATATLTRRPLVIDWMGSTPMAGRAGKGGSILNRLGAMTASLNLAISNTARDVIPAGSNVEVIYPPLEIATPPSDAYPVDLAPLFIGRFPVVLVVSRLAPLKGVHHLPPIIAQVARDQPRALFLIAGDGPLRALLEHEITRLNIGSNVALLGFRRDISALHAISDIYVSTSESEGLVGYSTLEAIIAGTPVIASNIPSVREVLRTDFDALLVEPADTSGYASAVGRIAEDPQLGRTLASNSRRRIEEKFDSRASTSRLLSVYRKLVRP